LWCFRHPLGKDIDLLQWLYYFKLSSKFPLNAPSSTPKAMHENTLFSDLHPHVKNAFTFPAN